jgi:hypothetical protein
MHKLVNEFAILDTNVPNLKYKEFDFKPGCSYETTNKQVLPLFVIIV